jgi:hypothetical protein
VTDQARDDVDEAHELDAPGKEAQPLELIAFYNDAPSIPIEPADRWRTWMNETRGRWANRCLPLLMANESGWVLLNPAGFEATWSGKYSEDALTIAFDEEVREPAPALSLFGYGILTWGVPYLFRTPPGYNLFVRGPVNSPKDGICALDGLVETDWAVATFTMNWKFTRPDHPVRFEAGEPFCLIAPHRRGELESFRPALRHFSSDAETRAAAKTWSKRRDEKQVQKFLSRYSGEFEAAAGAWEAAYFKGVYPDGTAFGDHETRRRLRGFESESP